MTSDARTAANAPPEQDDVLDLMGEASFPASDPPATWTWDVEPRPDSRRR
jgi:hypothetical protein